MQQLKIAASLLLFVTVSVCTAACSKQNLPVPPQPSNFSAALVKYPLFPAAGAKDTILISGGTNGWWVTMPSNNWAVITKLYGSGDFKLPVDVKANATGAAREIEVVVSPTFGQQPVTIKIKQSN